jgi:hypothetical protein
MLINGKDGKPIPPLSSVYMDTRTGEEVPESDIRPFFKSKGTAKGQFANAENTEVNAEQLAARFPGIPAAALAKLLPFVLKQEEQHPRMVKFQNVRFLTLDGDQLQIVPANA